MRFGHLLWDCYQMNATETHKWEVNIGLEKAWCRQATNLYLSQCWHKSVSPYGTTRPQWVCSPNHSHNKRKENSRVHIVWDILYTPRPCIITETWRSRKTFSQWQHSFHWKPRCDWLKGLRQLQTVIVIQRSATQAMSGISRERALFKLVMHINVSSSETSTFNHIITWEVLRDFLAILNDSILSKKWQVITENQRHFVVNTVHADDIAPLAAGTSAGAVMAKFDSMNTQGRCQAIAWTNDDLSSTGPLETNFNEISIKMQQFSFRKIHLKISSAKCRLFCIGRRGYA